MKDAAEDLARRRAAAAAMGGTEAVARQHAAGKLTVRERMWIVGELMKQLSGRRCRRRYRTGACRGEPWTPPDVH